MTIYYLAIATCLLSIAGCKKQPTELSKNNETRTEEKVEVAAISGPCFGNTWTGVGAYSPGTQVPLFVYNNKAYVIRDVNTIINTERVEVYDGISWQTLASTIPFHTNHPHTYAFSIGSKGYIGRSDNSNIFYEYDILTNTFQPKTGLPVERDDVMTFSIGNKGYVMGGTYYENGTVLYSNDTWEYDPSNDSWTQKADFSWLSFVRGSGFTIGNKGYLVNGVIEGVSPWIYLNSLLEYDPAMDKWTSKAAFPGAARRQTAVFTINNYGYAGGGNKSSGGNTYYNDFYRYSPSTNSWSQIATLPIAADIFYTSYSNTAFTLNSKGYVAFNSNQLARYNPKICIPQTP